jgi:hypothetical protein
MGRNCQKQLRKRNFGKEIELHVSTILKLQYYGIPCHVKKIRTGDKLRAIKGFYQIMIIQD